MIAHRPWALLAFVLVPLILWLARRRRQPQRTVWPSLMLWRDLDAIAQGSPKRTRDRLVWAECLAVALLALAAADLEWSFGSASLRVRILVDEGRHMEARLPSGETAREATMRQIARLERALDDDVEIVRGALPDRRVVRGDEDWLVLATYRELPASDGVTVVGVAPEDDNIGVDAVSVDGDEVWYAVRDARGKTTEHRQAWTDELVLDGADAFLGDNRVGLRRFALRVAAPASGPVRAAIAVGTTASIVDASSDLEIVAASGGERIEQVRGADCIARGLAADLHWGDITWRDVATTTAPNAKPLLTHDGRIIAAWLDDATLWIGMPLDNDWDEHGTLALMIELAKRKRVEALLDADEQYVGGAVASPRPGRVDLSGRTQQWDGQIPKPRRVRAGRASLRTILASAAVLVLGFYAFWLWSSTKSTGR